MAIRFDEAFVGMQFHPEADANGMQMYLLRDDKKEMVIEKHGEKKYWEMLDHLRGSGQNHAYLQYGRARFLMIGLKSYVATLPV